MQILVNNQHKIVMFYPETWRDVLKNLLTKLLSSEFKWTWGWNKYRSKKSTWTIEIKYSETQYPDCGGC